MIKRCIYCNADGANWRREVTTDQELDDVDISVHCDVKIFDWLMCWVKFDDPKVRNMQCTLSKNHLT
jgi:hypothetical protein